VERCLIFQNVSKRLVVAIDASQMGVGGILHHTTDDDTAITPEASKQRYRVYKQELRTVSASGVTVLTDHKPLAHVVKQRNPRAALQQRLACC
jgi:hypothetical protein